MDNLKDNKYNVSKYFDTYFEYVVRTGLTKIEAEKIAEELNSASTRYLVTYEVRG